MVVIVVVLSTFVMVAFIVVVFVVVFTVVIVDIVLIMIMIIIKQQRKALTEWKYQPRHPQAKKTKEYPTLPFKKRGL